MWAHRLVANRLPTVRRPAIIFSRGLRRHRHWLPVAGSTGIHYSRAIPISTCSSRCCHTGGRRAHRDLSFLDSSAVAILSGEPPFPPSPCPVANVSMLSSGHPCQKLAFPYSPPGRQDPPEVGQEVRPGTDLPDAPGIKPT